MRPVPREKRTMGTYLPQLRDNVCIQEEHLEDDRLSHSHAPARRNVQVVLRPRLQNLKQSRLSLSIHLPPLFDWHNGNLFNAAPTSLSFAFASCSAHVFIALPSEISLVR